jgi:hypothetical protein
MNERALRDSQRESEIQRIKRRKDRQIQCGHRKSETGIHVNGTLAFHFLKLPTGETIGVCPYCQKIISDIDPSDKKWFSQPTDIANRAESIQFLPDDDDKLFKQLTRYTPEEKDRILKETIADLKKKPVNTEWRCIQHDTERYNGYPSEQDMREMPLEDLKVLAQDFVKKTYPKRRKK